MRAFKLAAIWTIFCFSLDATDLNIIEKKIDVNGKDAVVYAIAQSDGTLGLKIDKNQPFDVQVNNTLSVPTSIHWHGLILPNDQDGVAFITQFPIYPTQSYRYRFPLVQSGTFWMHSHYGLQEQKLLAAPLIIYDPVEAKTADQDVTVMLADFTFESPEKIYRNLRCKKEPGGIPSSGKMGAMGAQDLLDVKFDAYLSNYRTLKNPETIDVQEGKKVRLRLINASSATNFHINLGTLSGEAIAVDGNRIKPVSGSKFELAVAQRIDIVVDVPATEGAYPILAQAEGTNRQTGLVLATKNGGKPIVSETADHIAGPVTNILESKLQALHPLSPRKADKQLLVELGGNMSSYTWTINGQSWPESTPLVVEKGQRVELTFKNQTSMSHPMHLHGHVFQVVGIDGKQLDGAMRDTVLVTPNSSLTIRFDADNPGIWPLHCHILYHLEAGMFTVLRYADFQQPLSCEAINTGN